MWAPSCGKVSHYSCFILLVVDDEKDCSKSVLVLGSFSPLKEHVVDEKDCSKSVLVVVSFSPLEEHVVDEKECPQQGGLHPHIQVQGEAET